MLKLKRNTHHTASSALLVAAACLIGISETNEAQACGGLFCSAANPVNQAAERIIFADNGDGTMTAVIEIQYEGPAERFSWVLPMPGIPEIGVSSTQVLDRVQNATNPRYQLNTIRDGSCNTGFADAGVGGWPVEAGVDESADPAAEEPVVQVVASGTAGPYDYEVLEVNEDADAAAQEALLWLERNDYDVTALGEDVIGEYLAMGLNLVAFRLTKDSDSGSIRPVMLTYAAEDAVIPIRPTAVAANENMGVLVWVLGAARAVPINYRTLELNEALIDWFNPNDTYNDVVIAAADEAGGHGFVTEMATLSYSQQTFLEWRQWDDVRGLSHDNPLDVLQTAVWDLGHLDGFVDAVRKAVPLRDGVTPEEFVQCVQCYFDPFREEVRPSANTDAEAPPSFPPSPVQSSDAGFSFTAQGLSDATAPELLDAGSPQPSTDAAPYTDGATDPIDDLPVSTDPAAARDAAVSPIRTRPRFPNPGEDPIADIDLSTFLGEVEQLVIKPMENTAELLERGDSITRLYTTLSPDEMTVDPVFDFNPDLGEVDSLHQRDRYLMCTDDGDAWTVEFDDGSAVSGVGNTWPLSVGDAPANQRILQHGTSGEGMLVTDNTEDIESAIDDMMTTPPDVTQPDGGPAADDSSGDPAADDRTADDPADDDPQGETSEEDDGQVTPAGADAGQADAGVDLSHLDDDGCGCAVPGSPSPAPHAFWGLLPLLGALVRRRNLRHSKR